MQAKQLGADANHLSEQGTFRGHNAVVHREDTGLCQRDLLRRHLRRRLIDGSQRRFLGDHVLQKLLVGHRARSLDAPGTLGIGFGLGEIGLGRRQRRLVTA